MGLAGRTLSRAVQALVVATLLAGCAPATSQTGAIAATTVISELRRGGMVIVMRHGADKGKDSSAVDVADCVTQGALTDAGRRDLAAMAADLARLALPISDVLASPYCRTLETARIVFGRVTPSDALVRPASGAPMASDEPRLATVKRMLSTAPPSGRDTVLVTHSEIIRAALGVDAAVGESIIVRPSGTGYVVVARIGVHGWNAP